MGETGFTNITDPPKPRSSLSKTAMSSIDNLLRPAEGTKEMQVFRLMHRLAVFTVAVLCVMISLESFSTAVVILRGQVSRDLPIEVYSANLITDYAGTATIKESPLILQVLEGSTSPQNNSVYLETPSAHSHTGCSNVANYNHGMYDNDYLRFIFSSLQARASYNISYLTELELIAPVVDCTFELLVLGDQTVLSVYYLVRNKGDPDQVMLLSTSVSVQDYEVAQQFQRGAGTVLMIAAINDTQATTLEHHIVVALNFPYVAEPDFEYAELEGIDGDNYWLLRTLPNQRNLDPAKQVRMARRFGRYKGDPTAQSNIETVHWDLPSDPTSELREWRWYGRAVLHDSWAWTHAIHGFFALNDIFNLSVLTFVIYRRLRVGHLWVGDAFATVSNMLLYRGVIVLICSHLNGYWTITKMCISIGDSITELANLFPDLKKHIVDFAVADATLGLLDVGPGLANLSPFELMTAYPIESDRKPVVFSAVISICSPFVLMLAYVAGRKSTRYASVPAGGKGTTSVRRRSSAYRRGFEQNDLTSFEAATGAALVKRFGVISSYENYVDHDKQLIASIDAVYGNGFLVANGKFLIGAQDLLPLVMMKLTRFALYQHLRV
ncbi:hypothetical protein PF005_g15331 [Phytophthora fragariae]|uniref:Transmembrane protein n=2 Tax=Phytophthora fragariae TaxID=53985 RepID=A0A6A3XN63_9STRA|nr:hypothetical protein PF005_g15331 [Phytophthora fragariae]